MAEEAKSMRVRLLTGLVLALILTLALSGAPSAVQGPSSLTLTDCAPPAGLQIPAGQGLAVRCRLHGEAESVRVRFLVDGALRQTLEGLAGDVVAWSWLPNRTGSHTLELVAYVDGRLAATFSRQVQVVPSGLPARIP
jgi:hypothetical protein